MFTRQFHLSRFLRNISGMETFQAYCRSREIQIERDILDGDLNRWKSMITTLSPDAQARIEFELAQVNELSGRDGNDHLVEANNGDQPPVDVPGGAALALWFLVHQPDLFREVFFHHEVREVHAWRSAKAKAKLDLGDLSQKADVLGEGLRALFRQEAGTGKFCAVEAYEMSDAVCFAARIADRIHLLEGFSERGVPTVQRVRPTLTVLFVYFRRNGKVLLKSHLRSRDCVAHLYQCFGRAVLKCAVTCDGESFDLDKLKQPFHPLPDAEDMALARLRALHLRYPERLGRRCIKLETLASDAPNAMDELLRTHVTADLACDLTVTYAELQVSLHFGGRRKNYPVRLWPDRCNLSQTPNGERLHSCLRRWGLCHA
jgi:hypothetical protein